MFLPHKTCGPLGGSVAAVMHASLHCSITFADLDAIVWLKVLAMLAGN